MACATKRPPLMVTALDTIQKLMAYGHIRTGVKYYADPRRNLVDYVITTACDCFDLNQEDQVQLQIITTLLTAITSCDVHGRSLHLAIKTCFNIHLVNADPIIQQTAKAALTQMLNVIFHKMESKQPQPPKFGRDSSSQEQQQVNDHGDDDTDSVLGDADDTMSTISDGSSVAMSGHHHALSDADSLGDKFQQQFNREPLDNETRHYVSSAVRELLTAVAEKFEKASRNVLHFDNQFQRDAFNIFRALCRLSMKALPAQ